MSKNIHWNPKLAEHEIMGNALKRLDEVGDDMVAEVKKSTPEGSETRPMYKTGPYKNKYWTSRDAGALKRSVHTAKKRGSNDRSIRVICGTTKAYYGKIIEYGTNGNKHKGFFRKSMNRSRRKAAAILKGA